jgi:cephalosporin hydroxylase
MSLSEKLFENIHQGSPYEGFDVTDYPLDLQGWLGGETVLVQIIEQLKPRLIVEVGTWKGSSAFFMIDKARKLAPDAVIICIDTWLGSPEHWLVPQWREQLNLKHGRADLYNQFIANVIHLKLTECVIPLPLPSVQAAVLLKQLGIRAAMVHIDGAHDGTSVRQDIEAFWPLVESGGAMVGDDYTTQWPGLMAATDEFLKNSPDIKASGAGNGRWFAQKRG